MAHRPGGQNGRDAQNERGIGRRAALATGLAAGAAAATTLSAQPAQADTTEHDFRADPHRPLPARPNVLVILADDLGWADLSSYGSPNIRTPNLDSLARQGVRFTDGYSSAAVCSPTRFALYTGRYPGRLRGGVEEPIIFPDELLGLPPEHPTLASLLKDAGYATAMFGKWHCGFLPWYSPIKSGWEIFYGNLSGAVDYYSKVFVTGKDLYEGEVPVESLEYYTDLIADHATDFVRRRHTKPWLLNLNFTAPHSPWEAPGDHEVSAELTRRIEAGDLFALGHLDGGSVETYRKMVESMDAGIGQVLRALRDTGQERNTIVLFSSDNGGERFAYHWPLVGQKETLNEGGIRVPTILRWPAAIRPRQVSHVPVVTHDWTATILEAAGVRPADDYPLDGDGLIPYLLEGVQLPERDLFWRTRSSRALRRGDWKYLRDSSGEALYNLSQDMREQANVARHHPERLARLRARWEEINKGLLPYPPEDSNPFP